MRRTLIGKKVGMTQTYGKDGKSTPVTVVEVSENIIANILKDGETVTHVVIGKGKKKNPNKPEIGLYKQINFVPIDKFSVKLNANEVSPEIGAELSATSFAEGDLVDVTATSKGKGFQGVVKKWGFHGGPKTHGQSDRHRAPGSIGSGTTMGRVFKGLKMAGHTGNVTKTVKNLKIIMVNAEDGLIGIEGQIPGFKGATVIIKEKLKQY